MVITSRWRVCGSASNVAMVKPAGKSHASKLSSRWRISAGSGTIGVAAAMARKAAADRGSSVPCSSKLRAPLTATQADERIAWAMPYALNLSLDADAALQIERAYASLARLGISDKELVTQYGPCVTFLVIDDSLHPDDMAELLGRHTPRTAAIAVTLIEPCIIAGSPPTLSLRVSPEAALLALHHAVFSGVPEQTVHLHYRPAYWQPHLKLSNVRPDAATQHALVTAVAAEWTPLAGLLDTLQVVRYPPTQTLWQAPLRRLPTAAG